MDPGTVKPELVSELSFTLFVLVERRGSVSKQPSNTSWTNEGRYIAIFTKISSFGVEFLIYPSESDRFVMRFREFQAFPI